METIKTHKLKKINIALNLILSTNAPIIKAGVIIANDICNVAKKLSRILLKVVSNSIELINTFPRLPIHSFP